MFIINLLELIDDLNPPPPLLGGAGVGKQRTTVFKK